MKTIIRAMPKTLIRIVLNRCNPYGWAWEWSVENLGESYLISCGLEL